MRPTSNAKSAIAHRRQRARKRSQRAAFGRVMSELAAASTKARETDPFVEQLRKCPETFAAGETLARMFDALKYDANQTEDERLLPPAGVVFPLV